MQPASLSDTCVLHRHKELSDSNQQLLIANVRLKQQPVHHRVSGSSLSCNVSDLPRVSQPCRMDKIQSPVTRNHAAVHAGSESVQLDTYYENRYGKQGRTVYLHHAATNTDRINRKL